MTTKPLTQAEVKARAAGLPKDRRNAIVCALVGHSKIVNACFGQVTCGRCDAIVADNHGMFAEIGDERVLIGHGCKTCRKAFAALDWRHKLYTPDPKLGLSKAGKRKAKASRRIP